MAEPPLARGLLAELLGAAFLAGLVIGSGIAAQTLSPSDVGLQLFENAAATAMGLASIILMFGPVSVGHFNPVVSLADATFGGISWRDALAYIPAQVAGCVLGAITANGRLHDRRAGTWGNPPGNPRSLRGDDMWKTVVIAGF
jgi:glycerol uptake facilitator-like aquaporin